MEGDPYTGIDPLSYEREMQENRELKQKNLDLASSITGSNFMGMQDENLIQYQINTDQILERIEHFLKGDIIKVEDGNLIYVTPTDPRQVNFNEYGVAEIMRIISMYVNKETVLSNYTEERINEILSDLGNALTDFLFCNYEQMGMDNKFKESKYQLIVLNILHVVESCYRRALGGQERESLRTGRIVTQNQPLGPGMGREPMKRSWNPFKPSTW